MRLTIPLNQKPELFEPLTNHPPQKMKHILPYKSSMGIILLFLGVHKQIVEYAFLGDELEPAKPAKPAVRREARAQHHGEAHRLSHQA